MRSGAKRYSGIPSLVTQWAANLLKPRNQLGRTSPRAIEATITKRIGSPNSMRVVHSKRRGIGFAEPSDADSSPRHGTMISCKELRIWLRN